MQATTYPGKQSQAGRMPVGSSIHLLLEVGHRCRSQGSNGSITANKNDKWHEFEMESAPLFILTRDCNHILV